VSKYLLLVKGGKGIALNKMAAADRKSFLARWGEWLRDLRARGKLVAGSPLSMEGQAFYFSGKTEEVPENYDMISEIITGFCVLKVQSEADAISIAQTCPFLKDEFVSCELRVFKSIS
jgi:hypothetical protein